MRLGSNFPHPHPPRRLANAEIRSSLRPRSSADTSTYIHVNIHSWNEYAKMLGQTSKTGSWDQNKNMSENRFFLFNLQTTFNNKYRNYVMFYLQLEQYIYNESC